MTKQQQQQQQGYICYYITMKGGNYPYNISQRPRPLFKICQVGGGLLSFITINHLIIDRT